MSLKDIWEWLINADLMVPVYFVIGVIVLMFRGLFRGIGYVLTEWWMYLLAAVVLYFILRAVVPLISERRAHSTGDSDAQKRQPILFRLGHSIGRLYVWFWRKLEGTKGPTRHGD